MIPIKPEEWEEITKEEFLEWIMSVKPREYIEYHDGENWRKYIKKK